MPNKVKKNHMGLALNGPKDFKSHKIIEVFHIMSYMSVPTQQKCIRQESSISHTQQAKRTKKDRQKKHYG
jgi:hypothetical protein